jgi:hypothetical protein
MDVVIRADEARGTIPFDAIVLGCALGELA